MTRTGWKRPSQNLTCSNSQFPPQKPEITAMIKSHFWGEKQTESLLPLVRPRGWDVCAHFFPLGLGNYYTLWGAFRRWIQSAGTSAARQETRTKKGGSINFIDGGKIFLRWTWSDLSLWLLTRLRSKREKNNQNKGVNSWWGPSGSVIFFQSAIIRVWVTPEMIISSAKPPTSNLSIQNFWNVTLAWCIMRTNVNTEAASGDFRFRQLLPNHPDKWKRKPNLTPVRIFPTPSNPSQESPRTWHPLLAVLALVPISPFFQTRSQTLRIGPDDDAPWGPSGLFCRIGTCVAVKLPPLISVGHVWLIAISQPL